MKIKTKNTYKYSLNTYLLLTQTLGADVFVFELVVGGVGINDDPLHAVAAQLLLRDESETITRETNTHDAHAAAKTTDLDASLIRKETLPKL